MPTGDDGGNLNEIHNQFCPVADLGILKEGFSMLVGTAHRAPPKAVRRAAKRRSVRANRGNFFLRVLFSDQEALS